MDLRKVVSPIFVLPRAPLRYLIWMSDPYLSDIHFNGFNDIPSMTPWIHSIPLPLPSNLRFHLGYRGVRIRHPQAVVAGEGLRQFCNALLSSCPHDRDRKQGYSRRTAAQPANTILAGGIRGRPLSRPWLHKAIRDCGGQQPRLPALGASPAPSPHSCTPRPPDACRHYHCSCHTLDPCRTYRGEDMEDRA
jgi:hypothetical protein